jgi:exopolysaccharide production protein ExoY
MRSQFSQAPSLVSRSGGQTVAVDARDDLAAGGTNGFRAGSAYPPTRAIPIGIGKRRRLITGAVEMTSAGSTSEVVAGGPIRLEQPVGGRPKRVMDLAIAITALLLLFPVMLMVMALIKATMGGPVIFSHDRIGYRGRVFRCYKFRTMVVNGDEILQRHLAENAAAAKEWNETRKLRNDPRITLLGHMLRKSSLDELPQLINVLRGEMSCVGPRPIVADELRHYGRDASEYLRARPGLTGAWQVSGRNSLEYARRVALDCNYVRNWSAWRDLVILSKTVVAVMHFDDTA